MYRSTENESSCCKNESSCCLPRDIWKISEIERSQALVDDAVLVQELNQLSTNERETILAEIHGVNALHEETPEFIQKCCEELQKELLKVSRKKRRNYDKAVFLKPKLERDVEFQLMFLRSDRYDAARAAHRLCDYFNYKLDLFGDEKLVKDIGLEDLGENDIEALKTGTMLRLPDLDQSGRPVLFADARHVRFNNWKDMTRAFWYVLMDLCTDPVAKKTGVVDIENFVGMSGMPPLVLITIQQCMPYIMVLPFRLVAMHVCYDFPQIAPALSLLQNVVGTQNRIRIRFHNVSHMEAQYELLTFGVRLPSAFADPTEEERAAMAEEFMDGRRKIEQEQMAKEMESLPADLCCLTPDPKDVLLGRGSFCSLFKGNLDLTTMLADYRDHYSTSDSRSEKTVVAMAIVQRINDNGGRFLERVDCQGWKLASNEKARIKVVHALRDGLKHSDFSARGNIRSSGGVFGGIKKRMRLDVE